MRASLRSRTTAAGGGGCSKRWQWHRSDLYESMVDTGHESYDPRLDYRGVIEVKMNEARKEERGYER